ARRGEAANESAVLEHGLLTYVLLRGMQAPGLRPLPALLSDFEAVPNADRNGDGFVTSRELRDYAEDALPMLASRLPDLAQRSGSITRGGSNDGPGPTALPVANAAPEPVRMQGAEGVGFRLIALPKGKDAALRSGSSE